MEWGIFSEEGLIEGDSYGREAAEARLAEMGEEGEGLHVGTVCPTCRENESDAHGSNCPDCDRMEEDAERLGEDEEE